MRDDLSSVLTMSSSSILRRTLGIVTTSLIASSVGAEPARATETATPNTWCHTTSSTIKAPCVPEKLSPSRRGLSVAASFVPGIAIHGSGHLLAGQTRTGLTLLGLEGLGVALAIGGLAGTAATGATRRFIAPMVLGLVAGGALLIIPALADIYGILAPEGGTGSPPLALPAIETRLGFAYVYDPNFAYSLFVTPGLDVRMRALRVSAVGYYALDDANTRTRASIAYRFFGPGPRATPAPKDGSFLDLEFALTNHDYKSNGFSVTTGELNLQGRLDLVRVGPTLRGSFAELGLGIAYAAHRYPGIGTEVNDLLTPRFAFGMYLGHTGYPRGEVSAYYEHRHDGFAGGMKSRGLGSGIAGNFGFGGRVYTSRVWGLSFDASAGSAYVGQASLLFRYGGNP
jgi:hypothetical protein